MFRSINIVLISLLTLVACSKKTDPGAGQLDNFYQVKTDGIALPVRVTGKATSDVALILTHGGPGGSSETFRFTKGIRNLESNFKIIYWDQRGSGITQGNPAIDQITAEQFAKDLDAIVEFTKQVIGAKSIFLLGHSWGGGLTSLYLTEDPARQAKLKGYINVNGAYNVPGGLAASRQWVINGAMAQISAHKEVDYWKKALNFYTDNPMINSNNFFSHLAYVSKLKGGAWSSAKNEKSYMPHFEITAFLNNPYFITKHITYQGQPIYVSMNLTPQIHNIKLPTLLIWGNHDGLLPPHQVPNDPNGTALVEDFLAHIGTPSTDVRYIEYMNSAHQPMAEEGPKFANDLTQFINKYK